MTNKELIAEARTVAGGESTLTEGDIGDLLACLVDLADALEAATEPDWEYGHEGDTLIGVHANASRGHAIEDAAHLTRYWAPHNKKFRAVRRRAAGPWLPVAEGNS